MERARTSILRSRVVAASSAPGDSDRRAAVRYNDDSNWRGGFASRTNPRKPTVGLARRARQTSGGAEQVVDALRPIDVDDLLPKLSRDALILLSSEGPRQLGEVDVATIHQRRGDSLKNGAIVGAVAGTAYFATMLAIFKDSDGGDVIVPTAIAGGVLFGGMGAAAGVGLDALISRRQVIYAKSVGRSRATVSPMFGRGGRGAIVTVRF